MEKSKEALENLGAAINHRSYLGSENLALAYVTEIVCPPLRDVLNNLRIHKVDESEIGEDKLVVHYTSIAALVSMLQDASKGNNKSFLRLYDSVHLNDPDEGNFFDRYSNLPEKYDWLGNKEVSHAYITSFLLPKSEEDMSNKLLFWRTYGEEGDGCSLSIPVPRCQLQKVLYGPESVELTVKELGSVLDLLDPLLEIDKLSIRESIQKKLAETVWESLERVRYLHKNEAYEYENECRSVVAESNILEKDKIRFEEQDRNNSPGRIRHYYEREALEIKNLLITGSSIMLGPCVARVAHPYNMEYYLKTLMRRANLYGPEIKTSKIPYLPYRKS